MKHRRPDPPPLPAFTKRRARDAYLVAYDVSTVSGDGGRRLRLAADVCTAAGRRVQWSVFECPLTAREVEDLLHALTGILDFATDRLLIVRLSDRGRSTLQRFGPAPAAEVITGVISA